MDKSTAKNSSVKKKIIVACSIITATLLMLLLIIPYSVSAIVYSYIFNRRYSTEEYLRYTVADFEGLQADRYEFKCNKNTTLVGYRYYLSDSEAQGVVVLSHGLGGGGQNGYMDVAYYFAQNGYDVFAYDATGNDESGGKSVKGLPQGVIDLHYTLDYIKGIDELNGLPVMLWGHSWGGYCASTVLSLHSEVKAIAAIAGFNCSGDLMESHGVRYGGKISRIMMPYVNSVDRIKFGDYAKYTAIDSFKNSSAGIFIAHSTDDDTVPIQYGYDKYYKAFSDNSRFKFVKFENKGHNDILYSKEYIDYMCNFYRAEYEFFGGREPTASERQNYFNANLDRTIYCDGLDKQLFNQIVEFYNSYL